MASIAASMRRLILSTTRQTACPPTVKIGALRSFSTFQPLLGELGNNGQEGAPQVQVMPQIPQPPAAGRRETYEGQAENDWQFDDFSSIAHAELERHREIRQYARIAAYEMPQLAGLARTFVLPNEKQILRFRYTTYMGEKHPAESKVVCEFATKDLVLTPVQRRKLIKLVGVRYNPKKDLVRMSCEMFENQAQNKRYLSDLVDSLITEAEDLSDDFEDIPLDYRHYYAKRGPPKPKFPKGWRMSPKRRQQLQEERAKLEEAFQQPSLQPS